MTQAAASPICTGCVACWKPPPLSCEQVGRGGLGIGDLWLACEGLACTTIQASLLYLLRTLPSPAALPALCLQLREALAEAVALAPRLGFGSGQDVMQHALAATDPHWQACVFGAAPPPAAEGAALYGRTDCHP